MLYVVPKINFAMKNMAVNVSEDVPTKFIVQFTLAYKLKCTIFNEHYRYYTSAR